MRKLLKSAFLLPFALALHSTPLAAQTDGLIDREIARARESSLWQLGPLWLTPQFTLQALYDTNPTFAPVSRGSDFGGTASPKLSLSVPVGGRVLFDVSQQVLFQYYRHNEELRDTFSYTDAGIAIGGRNVLAQGHGEYRNELTTPTSEFDVLAQQRTTIAESSLSFALATRQELTLGYVYRRIRLGDDMTPLGSLRASRLNRQEESLSLRLARQVSHQTSAVVEGTLEYIDFDEPRGSGNARSIEGVGGLEFSPTGRIHGKALLGYKRVEGEITGEEDFAGLVGSINTSVRLGSHTEVTGVYSRDAGPSVLGTPRFFTEERYGGFVEFFLSQRISVRPGAVIGTNSYRIPVRFIDNEGQEVEAPLTHTVRHFYLTASRRLTAPWVIVLEGDYLVRRSEAAIFNKDRLTVRLSFASSF